MPDRYSSDFGGVLRALRLEAGMSQIELASAAELDRTFISLLERNKRQPTLQTLLRLCSALGITLTFLASQIEGGGSDVDVSM